MKAKYLTFGLMMGMLSLASCSKDEVDNSVGVPEVKQITHTVAVSGEEWADDSRSSYTPEIGIKLDGTETVSVYYSVAGTVNDSYPYKLLGYVEGTHPDNDPSSFTFTHSAVEGAEAYDYFFMMPYLPTSKMNGSGNASYHRIGPVQMPKADTFDPNFDYIVGKPVLNVTSDDQSVQLTKFKRIMAPLRLKLSDGAGVLEGQKIQQVTIGFDAPASKANNKLLSGLFYYVHSENYDECKISGWETGSLTNAATADYPNGLEQEGNWETWLMVNPTEIDACNMTVTVVSDKMRITRTVSTGKALNIMKDKINTLSINVTGDGYTQESAYSVDFTQYTKVPSSTVNASDGYSYDWSFPGCTYNTQDQLGNALRLKNVSNSGAVILPKLPEGCSYKAVYITENTNNTSKAAPVSCKCDETEVATGSFSYYGDVSQQGGVLKLEIPAEYGRGPLTINHTCDDALWINRMTITYDGDIHAVDPNDYWGMYNANLDITVDGVTYAAGDYKYEKIDATTTDVDIRSKVNNVTSKTILFLDTKDSYTCFTTSTVNVTSDIVLISRYKDQKANFQPRTNWKLASSSENPASVSWHNLNIDAGLDYEGITSNNSYLLNNSGSTTDAERWVVTSCNLNNINKDRLYQHSSMDYIIKHIVFRNNIFQFNVDESADKYFFDFKATTRMAAIEEITINNNLIYNKKDETAWLRITSYTTTTDQTENSQMLNLALTNNTFVNMIGRQTYLKMYTADSFVVSNNIFYANSDYYVAKANSVLSYFYCVSPAGYANTEAVDVCKTLEIKDNIYYGLGSEGSTELNWNLYNSNSTCIPTGTKNSQTKLEKSPFETYDASNGKFETSTTYAQYGAQLE